MKKAYEQAQIRIVEIRGDILTVSGFRMTNVYTEEDAGAAVANGYNCYDSAEEL